MKKYLFAIVSLCAFGSLPASAALTVIYSTDFNSPTYANGAIVGQDSWLSSNGAGTNNVTVANSATDGTVTLTTTGEDVRRQFTPTITGGNGSSVFLTAEITVASAQATGDYFIHLGDGGSSNFFARTYIRSTTGGFQMALGTGSGAATYGTAVLTLGTPYTILVRYDFFTGLANDSGALFINPTTEDGTGNTAYVAATTIGTDATTFGSVHLRQGTAANAPGVTVDSITFAIPEPSTALLGTLGLFALLRRRR